MMMAVIVTMVMIAMIMMMILAMKMFKKVMVVMMIDFFPCTWRIYDVGIDRGKFYSVNVPLRDGIRDEPYVELFKAVIKQLIDWYRPPVILLQLGADSLAGDRIGLFNLTTEGHGKCVRFVKNFHIPMLVTGGGGYTKENVARCWCYETGILVDGKMENQLPDHDYINYYKTNLRLQVTHAKGVRDMNSRKCLDSIRIQILENLRHIPSGPSVQMGDCWVPEETGRDSEHERTDPVLTKFLMQKLGAGGVK
jgi:hypothetical protein